MKNIIKLDDYGIMNAKGTIDYGVVFIGFLHGDYDIEFIISQISDLNLKFGGKALSPEEMFANYSEGIEMFLYHDLVRITGFDKNRGMNTLNDFINHLGYDTLFYLLIKNEHDVYRLCEKNNCHSGKVGKIISSHYIVWKGTAYTYVEDMWEGRNWYSIGLVTESDDIPIKWTDGCYIKNDVDLDECVKKHFSIDEYYLVANEHADKFHKPKVTEIINVTYSFQPTN